MSKSLTETGFSLPQASGLSARTAKVPETSSGTASSPVIRELTALARAERHKIGCVSS